MASVSHFQKFLSLIDPKKEAVLFAFYNYLKNYHPPQDEFDESCINSFFLRSLRFEHWRKHKVELFEKTMEALQAFSHQASKPFLLREIFNLSQLELVDLKNAQDLCDVIQLFLIENDRKLDKNRLKIKPISSNRVLALQITESHGIKVHLFSPFVFIHKGRLKPIYPLSTLHYTPQVELSPDKVQELEVSPHHFARFWQTEQHWQGQILRGYTHQSFNTFKSSQLMDQFDIAQKIKNLEAHYVHLQSDPDYQNMIALLEKSIHLVDSHVEHSLEIAHINLKKGQMALDHLFPNDKQLQLLITNLEYSIMKRTKLFEGQWKSQNAPQEKLSL